MEINPEFLAPCGLYCGVCGILYATRDNNLKFKERLLGVYKGKLSGSEDLSVNPSFFLSLSQTLCRLADKKPCS